MSFMVGEDWRDLFDVITVNAKKPSFFTHQLRHFRKFLPEKNITSWREVKKLEKGRIYSRVSFN